MLMTDERTESAYEKICLREQCYRIAVFDIDTDFGLSAADNTVHFLPVSPFEQFR